MDGPPARTGSDASGRANRVAVAVLIGVALAAAAPVLSGCRSDGGTAEAASPAPSPSAAEASAGSLRPDVHRPDGLGHRSGDPVPCTPEMLRFHAGAAGQPAGRMLLSVTNYSDRPCDFAAQPYPLLHFGDGRRPAIGAIEASRPRAAVTLAPDRTAYAGITTSAAPGTPAATPRTRGKISQFGVALATGTEPTQVGLDSGAPVRLDPRAARVTHWQSRRADALKW
ncbi:DUF4232 domain-containing protein [Streptomyces sp. NPDC101393]|uniref:DUF4232 domain-containing protein n=1 Tax=Streptomyces sp. NPDC101393 TaxID=3366141 RepID=UPI0037F1543D